MNDTDETIETYEDEPGTDLERHAGEGQTETPAAPEAPSLEDFAALKAQLDEMRAAMIQGAAPRSKAQEPDDDDGYDAEELENLRYSDPKAYHRKLRELAVAEVRREIQGDIRDFRSQSILDGIARDGGDRDYAQAIIARSDPSILRNPDAVEMIRLASIGRAAVQGKSPTYRREPVASSPGKGASVRADVERMAAHLPDFVAKALLEEYR